MGDVASARRSSVRYSVVIELTVRQAELLLFFADGRRVGAVHIRTCDALIRRELIRLDEGSGRYRITEFGRLVAAAVIRQGSWRG